MRSLAPVDQMLERVSRSRSDGDAAYFHDLLYLGELLTKLAGAALVAALDADRTRNRYRLEYRLVRANGLGDWVEVIDECLVGPSSQSLNQEAFPSRNELQSNQMANSWQSESASALVRVLAAIDPQTDGLGARVQGRRIFSLFSQLRNKTRGHGAIPSHVCSQVAPDLEVALNLLYLNSSIFNRPWAFLHQNLSGRYRVSRMTRGDDPFAGLTRSKSSAMPDGVYIYWSEPRLVPLVHSDSDLSDFHFANGDFKGEQYESLSYRSGTFRQIAGQQYLLPPERLAESETQGHGVLIQQGMTFGNLPSSQPGYVSRIQLEKELAEVLRDTRNPVITLAGAGGIGKTSLTLAVLHEMAKSDSFGAILWFSARDIDLLMTGPKQVTQSVASVKDIADQVVRLLEPSGHSEKGFSAKDYLANALTRSPLGPESPLLFVFDNFETMLNPVETFRWLNNQIRLPNKILVTTRFREFQGDYHIPVAGMNDDEAMLLIEQTAKAQGVAALLTNDYLSEVLAEADGHPYVMKILVGELAKSGVKSRVSRIVASKTDILEALFERTYSNLSPAARRVFLLLARWRSTVPQLAVEAVVLRPANESLDVQSAIDELLRTSLVQEERSDEGSIFLDVPLAAGLFGRRKLETSPFKTAVEADLEILRLTGAAQVGDLVHGLTPRVEKLFRGMASRLQERPAEYGEATEMLEFVARRFAPAWLLLASLHEELGGALGREKAKEAIRRFLETGPKGSDRSLAWTRLAAHAREEGDVLGELHALIENSQGSDMGLRRVSEIANRVNDILAARPTALDSDEKRILVRKLVAVMEDRINEGSGDDHSRLAWLKLQLRDPRGALVVVEKGLAKEPFNYHCANLKRKLELELAQRR